MAFDLKAFLASAAARTDALLERALPAADAPPESLHQAMRYSVFAGGKRLRPALAFAASRLGKPDTSLLDAAAAALEMIHTYSLVHDDLPAMDDDALRRGKPTCHVVYGEAEAILAGDALVTLAFEILAAGGGPRRVEAVARLARAAGAAGMVGGQSADLAAERGQASATAETLEFIHRHKTGALLGASTALGALAGGCDPETVDSLERFGRELGLAFQIADDLLDVESSAEVLGKAAGKDAEAGKLTYPGVHGRDRAHQLARCTCDRALAILVPFGGDAEPLRALARFVIERHA